MAGPMDLQTYMQSIWDLIEPSNRRSGIVTDDEIRAKLEEAKTKIMEIIKDLEDERNDRVRIVSIPPLDRHGNLLPFPPNSGQRNSVQQQALVKPPVFLEDDADSDDDSDDSGGGENDNPPPPPRLLAPRASNLASGGTPVSVASTSSTSGTNGQQGSTAQQTAAQQYNPEVYRNAKKEKLDKLYRLLYWLDFMATGNVRDGYDFSQS